MLFLLGMQAREGEGALSQALHHTSLVSLRYFFPAAALANERTLYSCWDWQGLQRCLPIASVSERA